LVDLNEDKTNFITEFTINPHPLDLDKEYYAVVITQSQLDNGDDFDFNKMSGIYKAKVENRNNVYQNYFLAIKSDSPMKNVEIEIELQELPSESFNQEDIHRQAEALAQAQAQAQAQTHEKESSKSVEKYEPKKEGFMKIKYIIAFFVLICGGFLLYYFWKKSKPVENINNNNNNFKEQQISKSPKRSISRVIIPERSLERSPIKKHSDIETPRLFKPQSPSLASDISSSSSSQSSSKSSNNNKNRFRFDFDD
jgi:hypothetical protein